MASYQRAASEAIMRFGGEVIRYVGDGIMAFFGYPVAHDNDAERAVNKTVRVVPDVQWDRCHSEDDRDRNEIVSQA